MNQRRDARRNRARIVTAAAEVFRDEGALAPLDLVARRAGVGRGTVYRHFADRGDLVAAILEMRVDALEELAAGYPGADLLEHLLVEICALQRQAPGLMAVLQAAPAPQVRLEAVIDRSRRLLDDALDRAVAHGVVRPGVGGREVTLVLAMMDGVITAPDQVTGRDALDRDVDEALALCLRALRPVERLDDPVPAPSIHLAAP